LIILSDSTFLVRDKYRILIHRIIHHIKLSHTKTKIWRYSHLWSLQMWPVSVCICMH